MDTFNKRIEMLTVAARDKKLKDDFVRLRLGELEKQGLEMLQNEWKLTDVLAELMGVSFQGGKK